MWEAAAILFIIVGALLWIDSLRARERAVEAGRSACARIARPFSFVNPPADPVHEFYGIVVPGGPLSPRLARLQPGDTLYLAPNPAGFLVLSEVPDAETLWLISTGTGIAPFLSILR